METKISKNSNIQLTNITEMLILGKYYEFKTNYEEMIHYYLMALRASTVQRNNINKPNCLVSIFRTTFLYFIEHDDNKMIFYMLFVINENKIYDINNYLLPIDYLLQPIEKYKKLINNVSKLFNGTIISNFFSRITKEYLYNPVYGRLYHKNILFKYNKEAYNIMYKLFKLIKIKLLRNAIIKLKTI